MCKKPFGTEQETLEKVTNHSLNSENYKIDKVNSCYKRILLCCERESNVVLC